MLSNTLEGSPWLFSIAHFIAGGTDTNRRVFVNLVRPGSIVVEIGANVGNYTTLFSRLVGAKGQVHAFEPVSSNFTELSNRVQSLGSKNVSIQQSGLGERDGEFEIAIPDNDLQQASFTIHKRGSWSTATQVRRELVRVMRLDGYLGEKGIPHVDFIKLDVEGAELSVLRGGQRCLMESRPVLHLEINPEWLKDCEATTDDLVQLLNSLGYLYSYQIAAGYIKGYQILTDATLAALRSGGLTGDFLFSSKQL